MEKSAKELESFVSDLTKKLSTDPKCAYSNVNCSKCERSKECIILETLVATIQMEFIATQLSEIMNGVNKMELDGLKSRIELMEKNV